MALNLITDRTAEDVAYLASVLSKPMEEWTDEENLFFLYGEGTIDPVLTLADEVWTLTDQVVFYEGNGVIRGAYNHTDLNRVTAAMEELHAMMDKYGYASGYVPARDGKWAREDIPTASQLARYIANVAAIRNTLTVPKGTPATPPDMVDLTYEEANDIETILMTVDSLFPLLDRSLWGCGEVGSGEY